MKHVIVDDLDTAYQDEGQGRVVLMIHGWGSNQQAFDGLATALKSDWRVVRLDLPGFGGTQTPKRAWNLDDYATYLDGFLAKLSITNLHALIGHSLGGRIAIRSQATGHLRSDKLVLLASHGIASPHSPRNLFYKSLTKVGKLTLTILPSHLRQKVRRRFYKNLGATDYLDATPAMKDTFKNIINQDLRSDATKVTTDTLLIYGADDHDTPARFGELFAQRMPRARLEVVDGAGHYVFQDKLPDVAKLIKEFL